MAGMIGNEATQGSITSFSLPGSFRLPGALLTSPPCAIFTAPYSSPPQPHLLGRRCLLLRVASEPVVRIAVQPLVALDHRRVQSNLLLRAREYPLLDRTARDQTEDAHVARLTDPVRAIDRLQVHLPVPRRTLM